jgi:6-phosphogluconolactonase (cycloisomerase 2 family)
MRMKFNKSRLLLVSAVSLLAAGVLTACGTATTDFVYVASSKAAGPYSYGEIDVFEINAVSGAMRQIPTSPFPSGGRNPVAEAVSSDYANLYVVNQNDNTIVQFGIGSDGKLYPQSTVNTPGSLPMAVAVNGLNLFIVDTYQPLPSCSSAEPCSGSVGVFPIADAKSTMPGEPGPTPVTNPGNGSDYWPLSLPSAPKDVIVPTAIHSFGEDVEVSISAGTVTGGVATFTANQSAVAGSLVYLSGFASTGSVLNGQLVTVLSTGLTSAQFEANVTGISNGTTGVGYADIVNEYVYVTAYDSSVTPNVGYIFGFAVASSGALAPLDGGVPHNMGVGASGLGVHPSAIASDSSGNLYVTDSINGLVVSYSSGSAGLTRLSSITAGDQPSSIVVDPSYSFAYVANAQDDNVSAYSIGSNGVLTFIANYATGLQPVAIGIDPSTSHFLFTVNFLGNDISDFELSPTAGTLVNTQHSPYGSNAQPVAVVAIPHGSTAK